MGDVDGARVSEARVGVCIVDTMIILGVQNWGVNAKALFLNVIIVSSAPLSSQGHLTSPSDRDY